MAYQIFISYRRMGGEALAFLLHERLSSSGYKVFYDIESMSAGRFDTNLLKVMDECSDVVVILPPNALDRCDDPEDWLRQEVSHALKTGKNVIPLMMNGFTWPNSLSEDISALPNHQGINVDFNFFDGVLEKLKRYLRAGHLAASPPEAKEGMKHVLLWGDFDEGILEKLVNKLALGDNYFTEILVDAVEILSKTLLAVDTIVLIVTDVTKFSNNPLALARLNQTLVEYVRSGGRLVCTHDVVYRRTRNRELQELYGCQIVNFRQSPQVEYQKTNDCRSAGLFPSLPDSFALTDGEICWGALADDIDVFFETPDGIPLVFAREYGNGICIYMNSGDFKSNAPRSILKPEMNFVALLREAIGFAY